MLNGRYNNMTNNVNNEMISRFTNNLIMSDASLPHTSSRLSPITFTEFSARCGIIGLNLDILYKLCCQIWSRNKFLVPYKEAQSPTNMDIAEEVGEGWCKLIEYLNKFLRVEEIYRKDYKMHYIAHLCWSLQASGIDADETHLQNTTIFKEILSPIIYPDMFPITLKIVPNIMSFMDVRFDDALKVSIARAEEFVETHSKRSFKSKDFDVTRLMTGEELISDALKKLNESKNESDGGWINAIQPALQKAQYINADISMCEDFVQLKEDGLKCIDVYEKLDKLRKKYNGGKFVDDPEYVMDKLLDVYSLISKGLKSYHVSVDKLKKRREKRVT